MQFICNNVIAYYHKIFVKNVQQLNFYTICAKEKKSFTRKGSQICFICMFYS